MKTPLIITCLLLAQSALAQFDTGAWPSYLHPRSGATHQTNVYNALVERHAADAYLVSGSPFENPVEKYFRFQRTDGGTGAGLESSAKDVVGFMISAAFWLNSNAVVNSFDGFPLDMTTNIFSDAAGWGNIYTQANLPTNYLGYTPYRCLGGLGPFTNDTSVGHGYGWTNAATVNVNTNTLPHGRTNGWYTTDYGWQGAKDIAQRISWMIVSVPGNLDRTNAVVDWGADPGPNIYQWSGTSPNSWAEAKAFAATNLFNTYTDPSPVPYAYKSLSSNGVSYSAYAEVCFQPMIVTNINTFRTNDVQLYVLGDIWILDEFDAHGSGVSTNAYYMFAEFIDNTTVSVRSNFYNATFPSGAWPTEPTATGAQRTRGWAVKDVAEFRSGFGLSETGSWALIKWKFEYNEK